MSKNTSSKINFYYVNNEYIEYLKQAEIAERGFTCVPNVEYFARNKFLYGTILDINDVSFFVPVSSQIGKNKEFNFALKSKDKHKHIKGTLRFPYMIPVPNSCLVPVKISEEIDNNRKIRMSKELACCRRNRDDIEKIALHTYKTVVGGQNLKLISNSCDFKFLEQKCKEYSLNQNQAHQLQPNAQTAEHILPNEIPDIGTQGFGGLS